jgi:hypothetical protein
MAEEPAVGLLLLQLRLLLTTKEKTADTGGQDQHPHEDAHTALVNLPDGGRVVEALTAVVVVVMVGVVLAPYQRGCRGAVHPFLSATQASRTECRPSCWHPVGGGREQLTRGRCALEGRVCVRHKPKYQFGAHELPEQGGSAMLVRAIFPLI